MCVEQLCVKRRVTVRVTAVWPKFMASLASALGLPQHWGDGAGLDGLDAAHHAELQREALVACLRVQHEAGRPFAWLRPNALLRPNRRARNHRSQNLERCARRKAAASLA